MPVQVFRAPLRSRLDSVDPGLALDRAFALGLCGVGGRLAETAHSREDALARTANEYGERVARRLERFMDVPDGSVVWTRDGTGCSAEERSPALGATTPTPRRTTRIW